MNYPAHWLAAFVVTAVVEVPIVVAITRASAMAPWRRAVVALFGQLATHPLVWFVFPFLVGFSSRERLWLSEAWAFVAEAALYAVVFADLRPTRALAASAIANAASIVVGMALQSAHIL